MFIPMMRSRKKKYVTFITTSRVGDEMHIEILWGVKQYPLMFNNESNVALYRLVTKDEILTVLKSFAKDKCPGPDGWTIEFFLHFSISWD